MNNKLIFSFLERIALAVLIVGVAFSLLTAQYIQAQDANTNLTQRINNSALSVSIVDGNYASVPTPSIGFGDHTFSFLCGSTTATLGTDTQIVYIQNPDEADAGWSLTIAPTNGTTSTWVSAGDSSATFDFNDPNDGGCTDNGTDGDNVAGSLTINPSADTATTTVGNCESCDLEGISLGSEGTFDGDTVPVVTLVTANSSSTDIGDWKLTGVGLTQTIPGGQAVHADYAIDMTMTITASI